VVSREGDQFNRLNSIALPGDDIVQLQA